MKKYLLTSRWSAASAAGDIYIFLVSSCCFPLARKESHDQIQAKTMPSGVCSWGYIYIFLVSSCCFPLARKESHDQIQAKTMPSLSKCVSCSPPRCCRARAPFWGNFSPGKRLNPTTTLACGYDLEIPVTLCGFCCVCCCSWLIHQMRQCLAPPHQGIGS